MTPKTRTFYAFRCKKTGELARLYEQRHDYHDSYFTLTRDIDEPVFEAPSPDALAQVLFEDTPSYNTRREIPGWGDFRADELEAVQVTLTETCEAVTLPRLLNLKTVTVRDIPYIIARKYAGGEFEQLKDKPGLVFWLVELEEDDTLESVRSEWTGKAVFGGDRYTRRHVYACVPVPEDYVDLLKGKAGALLVASGSFY